MDRKTLTCSRGGLVFSAGLMLFNSWMAAAPIKPASIESNGGLATTAQLPGAAAGVLVNGNASGYAEITFNNQLYTGSGQTRYTAAGRR